MKSPAQFLWSVVLRVWLLFTLYPMAGRASVWVTNTIPVPNGSFESPTTLFVTTSIDFWQKTDKPPDFDESSGFLWIDETGIFLNTPDGASDHIINCDGLQAIYLFSYPNVGLFQDFDSTGSTSTNADREFGTRFEIGKSYQLTVGINAGPGSQLKDGTTIELDLYYRDDFTNLVTVVSNTVAHSTTLFPDHIHLHDFAVLTAPVQATDPWAGKHLGIRLQSTTATNLVGGYWDIDNIRLASIEPKAPVLSITLLNPGLILSFNSSPDCQYQLQISQDLIAWANSGGTVATSESSISIPIATIGTNRGFYRVLVFPKN